MKKKAKTQTENLFHNTTKEAQKFKKRKVKKCVLNRPKINLYQIIFSTARQATFNKLVMESKIIGYFTIKKKNKINIANFK